jgi:hypothetical protein
MRNIETNPKGTVFNIMRQYAAYADDVLNFITVLGNHTLVSEMYWQMA